MAQKPKTISTRSRQLIDGEKKPELLAALVEETNELITEANQAKKAFRETSKSTPDDKKAIASAKKALVAAIKKEDSARKKLLSAEKALEVRGFVDKQVEDVAKELLEVMGEDKRWERSMLPNGETRPQVSNEGTFLDNFIQITNPLTKTVYSPLNTITLQSFMKKHGVSTPKFITKNKAKELFGEESVFDSNGEPIPTVHVVSLKKDLMSYSYERDNEGKVRRDSNGNKIKILDSKGDPVITSQKMYGFSRGLVNVAHIRSTEVPAEWLAAPNEPILGEKAIIPKLTQFMIDEVSPVPVIYDNEISCSSFNEISEVIKTKTASHFKSDLIAFSELTHEVVHATGWMNFENKEPLPSRQQRESFVKYGQDLKYKAKEEITAQIAMISLLNNLNLRTVAGEEYDNHIANEKVYNANWARRLLDDVPDADKLDVLKKHVHDILTDSGAAYRILIDTMVSKIDKHPELAKEMADKLGEYNAVTLAVEATRLSEEFKAAPKAKPVALKI